MKKVVIDTSVAIKWFFPEDGKEKALELKDEHIQRKIVLCSRDLFLYEFVSAFENHSSSKIKIETKDFILAAEAIVSLNIKFFPVSFEEMEELFSLSRKLELSVYDCSYVLLAKKLGGVLYTADRKLFLKGKDFINVILI